MRGFEKKIHSRGFSLVELLVAMALISIVMALGIPAWQNYRTNTDLKTAAREIMADIANAKQWAVAENLDVRVTFNVGGNSYALTRTDGVTTGTWSKSLASYGNVSIASVNFSGGSVINLNRRGVTTTPGNLVLQNTLGSTATIKINITGRTYVDFDIH